MKALSSIVCLLLFIATMFSGCMIVPIHAIMRPEAEGSVWDAKTGQPIADARITMGSADNPSFKTLRSFVPATTKSESGGTFLIPIQQKWMLHDNFAPIESSEFRLSIEIEGYEMFEAKFFYNYVGDPHVMNFGKIPLRPLPK